MYEFERRVANLDKRVWDLERRCGLMMLIICILLVLVAYLVAGSL